MFIKKGALAPFFHVLLVAAVFTPFILPAPFGKSVFDAHRIWQLIALFSSAALLVGSGKPLGALVGGGQNFFFSLLLFCFSLFLNCIIQADFSIYALIDSLLWASLTVLALSVSLCWSESHARLFFACGFLMLFLYSLAIAFRYLAMYLHGFWDQRELLYRVDNIRFLNHVQTMAIMLLFWGASHTSNKGKWYYALIWVACANLVIILMSGGRGSIVSIISSLCILGLMRGESLRVIRVAFVCFSISIIIYFIFFIWLAPYIEQGADVLRLDSSGRIDMWSDALLDIKQKFWVGYGGMSFALMRDGFTQVVNAHPHNIALQIQFEYGIFPLLISMAAFAIFLLSYVRRHTQRSDLKSAVGSAIVAGLAHAMLCGVLVMPASQTLFFVLLGIYYRVTPDSKVDARVLYAERIMRMLAFVVVSVFCVLALLFWFGQESCLGDKDILAPRLWYWGGVKSHYFGC